MGLKMNKKRRAMLLMVITACMWSLGGIFIKLISWSPFLIAGIRSAIFIGEVPGMYALIGAIIILATVSWWCVQESRT